MSERRIGVYICHCGGNIADYVDVERVRSAAALDPGVVLAKTALFTCSDATQQEMIQDIREAGLDGLVVASCSPKLHLLTFRDTAKRAGLNPYLYTQVNVREQCSWAHTDDREGATAKAVGLVRAGVARTRLAVPLEPLVLSTEPGVLVVGAGLAGLTAAIALADAGLSVWLVESAPAAGGWVAGRGEMYPHARHGRSLIDQLVAEVRRRQRITLFTGGRVVEKTGSVGNFAVKVHLDGSGEEITLRVGAVVTATGFDTYRPSPGEYGYGLPGVLTLPEFNSLLDRGPLTFNGRRVKSVVYVYCVGSRQEEGRTYCSRYCCNAAVHASLLAAAKNPGLAQYHLTRDVRTYGKFEISFNQSRTAGSIYLKFDPARPPVVEAAGAGLRVAVHDILTYGEEVVVSPDLVVLVTGMLPRENAAFTDLLKLPVGRDGFFNEIHPKLRPVETVVDGVFIAGACQGPKNAAESTASALAAAAQACALLKKGRVELDPLVAAVDQERCTWCGACAPACPYGAIEKTAYRGRETAQVNRAVCKGCGGCVPLCPAGALDVNGYTDGQILAMIEALGEETGTV